MIGFLFVCVFFRFYNFNLYHQKNQCFKNEKYGFVSFTVCFTLIKFTKTSNDKGDYIQPTESLLLPAKK